MVFRLLLPCVVTAGSILVDNLIRNPYAETADGDMQLLQNVRQSFNVNNSISEVLTEFERISQHALRRIAPSPILSRIPESQQSQFFPQSATPQQWALPFRTTEEHFVARPISSYDPTFSLTSSMPATSFSQPNSVSQPYSLAPQYTYPYEQTDPAMSSSMASVGQPIIPQSTIQSHNVMSTRYDQSSPSLWGQPGTTSSLSQPVMQSSSQPPYNWQGSTTTWEQQPQPLLPPPPQPRPQQSPSRPHRGRHKKQPSSTRGSQR